MRAHLALALLLLALPVSAQHPTTPHGPSPDWTPEAFRAAHSQQFDRGGDPFTLTGRWAYGPSYALEIVNDLNAGTRTGYAGQGSVLRVLDYLPDTPNLLGEVTLPGVIYDVAAASSYLYVGVGGSGGPEDRGLFVVDVSDRTAPAVVGSYTTAEGFSGYGVSLPDSNDRIYVSAFDGSAALYVMDVSDPVAPVREARLALPGFSYGLVPGLSHVYVAGGNNGLHVVNVTNPAAPVLATTLDLGGYVRRAAISQVGDTPYVAVAVGSYASGTGFVALLDITNEATPVLAVQGPTTAPVEDVAWGFPYLYAASSYDGLFVYDASGGMLSFVNAAPTSTANLVSGANRVVGLGESRAYVADYYNGIHTFAEASFFSGFLAGQNFAYDVVVDATDPDVGYLAGGAYGLVRLGLTAPGGPVETGRLHTPAFNYSYAVAQTPTHLYLADGYSGVWVIQKQGLLVTNALTNGFADGVYTSEDRTLLFVVNTQLGSAMQAYSLTDPNNPGLLWERFDLDANDVESAGSVAYVGTRNEALVHVLDGADTAAPSLVRSLPVAGNLVGLDRDGGRLYAYGGPSDVVVFDLTNPLDPEEVGVVTTEGGFAFEVEGNVLYAAMNVLTAYDVSDPAAATHAGSYAAFAAAPAALAVRDAAVYVAARNAGAYRLASDLSVANGGGPSSDTSLTLSVAPNPLSGRASVYYVLPATGYIRLVLYDALGRRVAVPLEGAGSAGPHEAALDLPSLPAGRYFLRLETTRGSLTRPLTIVR